MGKIRMLYHNTEIHIYSLERMLIELMRFKSEIPFDYYKEIVLSYRKKVDTMDIAKVEEYAEKFRKGSSIMDMIQMEVL